MQVSSCTHTIKVVQHDCVRLLDPYFALGAMMELESSGVSCLHLYMSLLLPQLIFLIIIISIISAARYRSSLEINAMSTKLV